MKLKLPDIPNPFARDPLAVAARQEQRTARTALRQGGQTTRAQDRQGSRLALQPGRNANRQAAREAGTSPGQILGMLHGQANLSAEKFWGVADGGENWLGQVFGGGSGGGLGGMFGGGGGGAGVGAVAPAGGLPGWVLPVGLAAVALAAVVAVTR